jgi:uncharacterized protein (DUF302 family)
VNPKESPSRAGWGTIPAMIVKRSAAGYTETVTALLGAIEHRGLRVFAQIDHAAGARAAGLELEDEQVVVFGSPLAGTPLMAEDPRVGIELPLRMLVWRAGEHVNVGYGDPRDLGASYDVAERASTLEQMAMLLDALASEAAGG